MKNMTNLYKPLILTCLACMTAIAGRAQGVEGDKYKGKLVETKVEITGKNHTAVAFSKTHDGDTEDSNACDGDEESLWKVKSAIGKEGKAWWGCQVEDYSDVEQIDIFIEQENRRGSKIEIYSSSTKPGVDDDGVLLDDVTGDLVATITEASSSDRHTVTNVNLTGEYVWLKFTNLPNENQVNINEIYFRSDVQTTTTETVVYDYTKTVVKHKPAKWYDVFNTYCNGVSDEARNLDSFDETGDIEPKMKNSPATDVSGEHIQIQNTHELVDTIYVKKGTNVTLSIPDWLNSNASNRTYQRWYNYETDGTFATGKELNSEEEVVDWLTPGGVAGKAVTNGQGYRFANGYIGGALRDWNNDDEDDALLYTMNFHYPTDSEVTGGSKDHYIVACDLSGYRDFTETYTSSEDVKNSTFYTEGATEAWEPTLSHRLLYYIIAVEDKKPPVDVKNITFAATRIPNNTDEMVALSRDARSYTIPKNTATQEVTLKAKIVNDGIASDNQASIALIGADNDGCVTLTGENRVISFKYDVTPNEDQTLSVKDGSKATIIVYNTASTEEGTSSIGTEVARFNLTFVEKYRLMSQSQVARLNYISDKGLLNNEEQSATLKSWEHLIDRTPQYLDKQYALSTELNFDFEEDIADKVGYQDNVYPFPLLWSSSSYGFYDGSVEKGEFLTNSSGGNDNKYPQWGYYGIIGNYMECAGWGWNGRFKSPDDITSPFTEITADDIKNVRNNSETTASTYHLYADVSDRPGTIARLPFNDELCRGTELFVTAWVKAARGGSKDADTEAKNNAGALFTIMGVKDGVDDAGNKIKTYTPIYRYSTGQIPTTYYNDGKVNLPGFCGYDSNKTEIDGTTDSENANNEWMQAFFSFVNEDNQNFDSYALQIDNNSASTNGGDIYIDDIRVYVRPVRPTVTQLTANCDDEKVRMNVTMNFERLLSRVGADEETIGADQKSKIAFMLVEKAEFDAALGDKPTTEKVKEAIETSKKVNIYTSADKSAAAHDHIVLTFNNNFSLNPVYSVGDATSLPVDDGTDYAFHGQTTTGGSRMLTSDFYADVRANHSYYMLVSTNFDETEDWKTWFYDYGQVCAIDTVFSVSPQNMLRINGEIVDPTLDYCANATYNFTAELRVPHDLEDSNQKVYEAIEDAVDKVSYDWFFGTEEAYTSKDDTYSMSLEEALVEFRKVYREAEAVENIMYEEAKVSANALDMIKSYSEKKTGAAEGQHAHPLVLGKKSLNITLLEAGLNLVVQPIRTDLNDITDVCWNYIPLTMNVEDSAPTVKPGFNTVKYPGMEDEGDEDYSNLDPCLRIGLHQIESVSIGKTHSLTVNLRAAKYTSKNQNGTGLFLMDDESSDVANVKIDGLYLVSTDDPDYSQFFTDGDVFDQMTLSAGKITFFEAHEYKEQGDASQKNYMTLQFDLTSKTIPNMVDDEGNPLTFKFEPKEGYTYNFAVHFVEYGSDNKPTTACPGHFILPVKVVPEYVKWEGSADGEGNWNNDSNWKRVSAEEMNMDVPATPDENLRDDVTFTNEAGFVPMLFTKVIMPRDSKVKLYRAGYNNNSWELGDPNDQTDSPDLPKQKPTLNIQYDLMAYGNESEETGDIVTQLYRVNLCDEIHFEPGAEMLRPEYLLYNKAWIDMEVPAGEWTLVSTPLQDVVSGDWFTTTDGKQATKYFADIKFADGYNRLKPFVTQRTWTDGANIVGAASDGVDTPVSFTATWSALFNDTSVPYAAGNGYSVKTASISSSGTSDAQAEKFETLTFRFPKADTQYDMSSSTISRTNTGRLVTDGILKRTNTNVSNNVIENEYIKEAADIDGITLKNIAERTDGGTTKRYAIVGNPFMANLDVSKFIEKNSDVLEPKYWTDSDVNGTEAGTATQNGTEWSWNENSNGLVGQYKAFCVELKYGATPVVKFTPDMAVLTSSTDETTETTNLVITAKSADATSTAALAYDAQANDGYVSAEDAELITDLLGNGNNLSVYTVADNTAVSVNKIKDLRLVPVGLFADDKDVTKVTFTGVAALLEPTLYDAETNTETALTEGYTLTIDGESHGRYFIRTRGAGEGTTDIEETVTDGGNDVNVYSVESGKVVVASDTELLDVVIYSVGGAVLKHETVSSGRTAITLDNVDSGVVIVKVTTADCTITRKIIVR